MRFAILPLLALSALVAGCADQGTLSPDQQARTTPQLGLAAADPDVAPTGTRAKGVAPDPFSCTVTQYDATKAPTYQTGPAILTSSNCAPFVQRR